MFMTMTYQGLFDLSKRFLDPFHNEGFWNGHDPIRVDTLIAETNAGSRRWMFGLESMPIPLDIIQDGGNDLDHFILPDEGYTVEEAAEIEAIEEEKMREMEFSTGVGSADEDKLFEDEQLTFQEEFEETQAIMSAPPGADFVPGIDDVDEEECFMEGVGDEEEASSDEAEPCEQVDENKSDEAQPPIEVYDTYMETATEEYEEALRRDLRGEGGKG